VTLPRFAVRRDEAAATVGVSPSKFDDWVKQKRMPAPVRVDGVTLWDLEAVWQAWVTMRDSASPPADDGPNPFDNLVA
jgi:predicted DNA-binding transcriptional regulator AlpA